jgi:ABC-type Fe3+ transport system permease subunit
VIARPLPYEYETRPRVGTRSGRTAAHRRRGRTKRRRYAVLGRIVAVTSGFTTCIAMYLGLMANVTWMNYELGKSEHEKRSLLEISARLDDRIARMESRERLAKLAAHLGMHEPQTFASVALPVERQPAPTGLAFLRWLK